MVCVAQHGSADRSGADDSADSAVLDSGRFATVSAVQGARNTGRCYRNAEGLDTDHLCGHRAGTAGKQRV